MSQNMTVNHDAEEGDKFETDDGNVFEVVSILGDGAVNVRRVDGEHGGASDNDTWGHDAFVTTLMYGDVKRVSDGKSHELVGSF